MRPRSDSTISLTGQTHAEHDWDWILSQDAVWVDARRREHAIERMAADYVANVIDFCHHYLVELDSPLELEATPLLAALRRRLQIAELAQALRRPGPRLEALAEPAVATADNEGSGLCL